MCYLCSENKGADQLRGYREADLRLCFRICRLLVFSRGGSFFIIIWGQNIVRAQSEIVGHLTETSHELSTISTYSVRIPYDFHTISLRSPYGSDSERRRKSKKSYDTRLNCKHIRRSPRSGYDV